MGVSKRPLEAGEVCEDQRLREGMLPVHQEVVKVGEAKAEPKAEKVEKKSTKKEEVEVAVAAEPAREPAREAAE